MAFKNLKIQQKFLVAMLACVLLPTALLSGYIIYQSRQVNLANDNLARTQIEENMCRSILNEFSALDSAAYDLYGNFGLLKDIQAGETGSIYYTSRNALTSIFGLYTGTGRDNLLGITLYDTAGEQLSYYLTYRPVRLRGAVPEHYQLYQSVAASEGEPRRMMVFLQDEDFGMEIARYYAPIVFKGDYIAFLEFTLRAEPLRKAIEGFNQFYRGCVYLTTRGGTVLYDSSGARTGRAWGSLPMAGKNRIDKDMGSGLWLRYIYEDSPATRMSLLITVGVFLLTLSIALLLSYTVSRRVTSPIVELKNSISRVKGGNYGAKVEVSSQDEIGQLGQIFNEMTDTIQQHIEYEIQSKLRFKDAQLGTLQAQISPHFLHNTLQAITEMAHQNSAEDITAICKSLSDMYRYNMHIEQRYESLENEVMHVRNYMLIISKRYPGALRFRVRLPFALQGLRVPKLILQPIVENAVEHGLLPSAGGDKLLEILFEARGEEGVLRILVRDNGVGVPPGEAARINQCLCAGDGGEGAGSYESIGLYNVQRRIQLLCGPQWGMGLASAPGEGTLITYTLPLTKPAPEEGGNAP